MKSITHFTFTFILLYLLAGSHELLAQSCYTKASVEQVKQMAYLKGEWKGTLVQNSMNEPLYMKIYEKDNLLLVAISGGGYNTPLNAHASVCALNKYHFFGETIKGETFSFNAFDRGGHLEGTLAIGNVCGVKNKPTFKMSRVSTLSSKEE